MFTDVILFYSPFYMDRITRDVFGKCELFLTASTLRYVFMGLKENLKKPYPPHCPFTSHFICRRHSNDHVRLCAIVQPLKNPINL